MTVYYSAAYSKVCCIEVQRVAASCSVLQRFAQAADAARHVHRSVAVCCGMLRRVAVCCSVLQCITQATNAIHPVHMCVCKEAIIFHSLLPHDYVFFDTFCILQL